MYNICIYMYLSNYKLELEGAKIEQNPDCQRFIHISSLSHHPIQIQISFPSQRKALISEPRLCKSTRDKFPQSLLKSGTFFYSSRAYMILYKYNTTYVVLATDIHM